MHPILFHLRMPWGDVPVYAYGTMLGLALLAGFYATERTGRALALDAEVVARAYAASVLAGLVGARLGYALANPHEFQPITAVLSFAHGGLLGSSALVCGAIALLVVARREGVAPTKLADLAMPGAALAVLLMRVGCYFSGCDYGRRLGADAPAFLAWLGRFPKLVDPSDPEIVVGSPAFLHQMASAGSDLPVDARHALPVHPIQLYEALLGALVLALALVCLRRHRRDGDVVLPCALVYGVGRALLEPLRADPERGFAFGVPVAAIVASLVALAATIVLVQRALSERRPVAPA